VARPASLRVMPAARCRRHHGNQAFSLVAAV
jgi:hypothetical protein